MGDEGSRRRYRKWYHAHPEFSQVKKKYSFEVKLEVLSHYGPEGKLQCSWPGCEIDDPDMLALDHVHNDGAKDRAHKKTRAGGGTAFYQWLRKRDFPSGFQTLCHNHNWKKELMRRRENG